MNFEITEIYDNYMKNIPTMIISHSQLEISIGLLISFMKKYADININTSIKLVQEKLCVHGITFSDSMIRLLQLANS